jgi:hypothetical protein
MELKRHCGLFPISAGGRCFSGAMVNQRVLPFSIAPWIMRPKVFPIRMRQKLQNRMTSLAIQRVDL